MGHAWHGAALSDGRRAQVERPPAEGRAVMRGVGCFSLRNSPFFPQKRIPLRNPKDLRGFPSENPSFSLRIQGFFKEFFFAYSLKEYRFLQGMANPSRIFESSVQDPCFSLRKKILLHFPSEKFLAFFPSEKKIPYIFPQKNSLLFFPQKKNPPTFSLRNNPCLSSLLFRQKRNPPTSSLRKHPCPSSMCQPSSLRNYLVFPQNLHGFPSVKDHSLNHDPCVILRNRHPYIIHFYHILCGHLLYHISSVDTLSHILHPLLHIL